ncbi:MAG: transposase [Cyanobacteria bacterium P01_D01_bin.36]
MRTFKFKLYESKRNRYLKRTINTAAVIYNHCIALHKRYYRMFGKFLTQGKLKKHIAKLRKRIDWWKSVGSQAVQDIIERIDRAYVAFFERNHKGVRPPTFKKVKKYTSFTLKQTAGFKFLNGNRLKIGKRVYKFFKSREIEGKIKTLTIKRDKANDLFITVVTDGDGSRLIPTSGRIAGFDFGLKTFLISSEGEKIQSPLFLKRSANEMARLQRILSRKKKGSNNWNKARIALAKAHRDVANKRRDWFFKLANDLTDRYDYLFFETLNIAAMKKLWGRKVSDLAFREFTIILGWVAKKKGKVVDFIDPWYPSTKTCSCCNHKLDKINLNTRLWRCPSCKNVNDRDENAAINIKRVGASTHGLQLLDQDLEIVRLAA